MVEVQERGVEVIFVSGDGGQYTKGYHYEATSGVQFFLSGINNSVDTTIWTAGTNFNFKPDSILLFDYDIQERKMDWRFVNLDEFVQ